MSISGPYFSSRTLVCPVCGKKFNPAPEHSYKVGNDLVCTYTCSIRGEKTKITKKPKGRKAVLQFDLQHNLVARFSCAKEAEVTTKIDARDIRQCCYKGATRKRAGGFFWEYEGEKENDGE